MKNIFPAADGRIKLSGGDQELRRPTLIRDHSILYLRALQCHSGRNPIDPSQQYNVLIPDNILEYIYHIGCAINLHSITNLGLIPGGQNLGKERQTLFFTAVNPMDKKHKDPYKIVLLHHVLHGTKQKNVEKHQDTVYWVEKQLAQRKGSKFYQTKSNATILQDTLSAYCIPRVAVMESGEIIHEKVKMSLRFPPQISLKGNWVKELDSEVAGSSEDSQQIQPKSKTQLSRTERPVSGQPTGSFTQFEEIDIDFRVSGLPHAVVKQAGNFSVEELVKKIESHPHREAFQADLQQNNVYNPFSNHSKAMIREYCNVELSEECEIIP